MSPSSRPRRPRAAVVVRGLLVSLVLGACGVVLPACNDAQAGLVIGAGLGALAGNAIGGDTESTVIGTAVGAGAGYVIGNESDKARAGHGFGYGSGTYHHGGGYGGPPRRCGNR